MKFKFVRPNRKLKMDFVNLSISNSMGYPAIAFSRTLCRVLLLGNLFFHLGTRTAQANLVSDANQKLDTPLAEVFGRSPLPLHFQEILSNHPDFQLIPYVYHLKERDPHLKQDCPNIDLTLKNHSPPRNGRQMLAFVNRWKFDPQCFWKDLVAEAKIQRHQKKRHLWGFTVGASSEASVLGLVGPVVGGELLLLRIDAHTLMVGFVTFKGITGGFSIPLAASAYEGLLLGDCKNGVQSYLGWFAAKSPNALVRGKVQAYGNTGTYIPFGERIEGCSSISLTGGIIGHLFSLNVTYYQQWGSSILLRGREITDFISWMDAL